MMPLIIYYVANYKFAVDKPFPAIAPNHVSQWMLINRFLQSLKTVNL